MTSVIYSMINYVVDLEIFCNKRKWNRHKRCICIVEEWHVDSFLGYKGHSLSSRMKFYIRNSYMKQ